MSDPGSANGPREPGEAERPMITADVEGGWSAGVRVAGRGVVERAEAGGGSIGFPHPERDGSQQA